MAAGDTAASPGDRSSGDVLRMLRTETACEHAAVERALDLLDPGPGRVRLIDVLRRLHGFWLAAEAGLDDWAARSPADAEAVDWSSRRRAALFAADLGLLAGPAEPAADTTPLPRLPGLPGTDEALGRLYVLEGSTLGGVFIDRHLAALPGLSGVRLQAFCPYGAETGAMWHAFRTATRDRITAGGDAAAVVAAARETFAALAAWCRTVAPPRAVPA